MDYDLGSGRTGDDGLTEVRNIFRYKDVVFYSARAADLLTLVTTKKIQGVFCSTRLELPDIVNGVFEALVKKVLDIDHSRGIIMGATSDIDYVVNDCLVLACDQSSGPLPESARKIIDKRMVEIRKRFAKDAAAIEAIGQIEDLFELHNVYTSVDRLNLLRKVLAGTGKHKKYYASMKGYVTETVPKRNVLAHVKVQREGFSRKLFDREGRELTCDEMRELRLALLEHQEVFEALAADLKASVGQSSTEFP